MNENLEQDSEFLDDGPIKCIFFCEFHHTAGPIITCQVSDLNLITNVTYKHKCKILI